MGSLLSLPLPLDIISIILIPSAVSYATSANILFFYTTWISLIISHSPLRLEIVGSLIVKLLFYVLPSWVLWSLDLLHYHVVSSRKPKDAAAHQLKGGSTLQRMKIALWATFNTVFEIIFQAALELFITKTLKWERLIRTTFILPLPWQIAFGLVKALVVREVISYFIHRFVLHNVRLRSPFITRKHLHWYHALPKLGPFTATYDHPAAYIVNQSLPTFLAAAIVRLHLITYIIYMALLSLGGSLAYCDFGFVMSGNLFTFAGAAGRQARKHLEGGGKGNFGGLEIMDWICGTQIATESDVDGKDDVVEVKLKDLSDDLRKRVQERADVKRRKGTRVSKRRPKKDRDRDRDRA